MRANSKLPNFVIFNDVIFKVLDRYNKDLLVVFNINDGKVYGMEVKKCSPCYPLFFADNNVE